MMRGLLLEMFALSQKRTFAPHKSCPLYPENDINDVSGCAATAGERDGSGSAFAPRIQRRSTGLDYRNRDCPPKYCLYGSSLRTSDTGSPNTHYLWRPRSSRTMGRCKPELVVNQQSRQARAAVATRITRVIVSLHTRCHNNTERPVSIRCRHH